MGEFSGSWRYGSPAARRPPTGGVGGGCKRGGAVCRKGRSETRGGEGDAEPAGRTYARGLEDRGGTVGKGCGAGKDRPAAGKGQRGSPFQPLAGHHIQGARSGEQGEPRWEMSSASPTSRIGSGGGWAGEGGGGGAAVAPSRRGGAA